MEDAIVNKGDCNAVVRSVGGNKRQEESKEGETERSKGKCK